MDFGGLDCLIIGHALDVREYSFLQCSIAYLPGDNQCLLVILEGLVVLPSGLMRRPNVIEGGAFSGAVAYDGCCRCAPGWSW